MVCFQIHLAFRLEKRDVINESNVHRFHHLAKHYLGTISSIIYDGSYCQSTILLCDEDAVAFLRDLPPPVFVTSIQILRSPVCLYSFYKWTKKQIRPPKNLLLKQVYWMASSLESRHSNFQREGI